MIRTKAIRETYYMPRGRDQVRQLTRPRYLFLYTSESTTIQIKSKYPMTRRNLNSLQVPSPLICPHENITRNTKILHVRPCVVYTPKREQLRSVII